MMPFSIRPSAHVMSRSPPSSCVRALSPLRTSACRVQGLGRRISGTKDARFLGFLDLCF